MRTINFNNINITNISTVIAPRADIGTDSFISEQNWNKHYPADMTQIF